MKGYKEIIVPVPAYMKWFAIDADGEQWIYSQEPVYKNIGWWNDGGISWRLGIGPKPRDASKELYRI